MSRSFNLFVVIGVLCVSAARAETVASSTADCQMLVQHVPRDDVAFTPGVDVRGKPVAPADLGGGYQLEIPEAIDIQIGIDLADRLGLRDSRRPGAPQGAPARRAMPFEGKAPLGTLTIKGNDAYWNNARLVPQDEALLAEACRGGLKAAGVVLPTAKPPPPTKP